MDNLRITNRLSEDNTHNKGTKKKTKQIGHYKTEMLMNCKGQHNLYKIAVYRMGKMFSTNLTYDRGLIYRVHKTKSTEHQESKQVNQNEVES